MSNSSKNRDSRIYVVESPDQDRPVRLVRAYLRQQAEVHVREDTIKARPANQRDLEKYLPILKVEVSKPVLDAEGSK
jgi:hypothetical protein